MTSNITALAETARNLKIAIQFLNFFKYWKSILSISIVPPAKRFCIPEFLEVRYGPMT